MLLVQITHLGIATALLVLRLLALQQLASAPPATSSVTTYDEETGEWVTVTTTATVTLSSLLQARVDAGGHDEIYFQRPSAAKISYHEFSNHAQQIVYRIKKQRHFSYHVLRKNYGSKFLYHP